MTVPIPDTHCHSTFVEYEKSVVFVQLANQLPPEKNVQAGHYTHTFHANSFIPAMLKGTIDLYHFKNLKVSEFDLGSRSQGQQKAKSVGIIISNLSQMIRVKSDVEP